MRKVLTAARWWLWGSVALVVVASAFPVLAAGRVAGAAGTGTNLLLAWGYNADGEPSR